MSDAMSPYPPQPETLQRPARFEHGENGSGRAGVGEAG